MRIATRSSAIAVLLGLAAGLPHRHVLAMQDASSAKSMQQENATEAIRASFQRQTQRLADSTFANVNTIEDWQAQRPVLREQLLEMLGLAPLPNRTDLHATVTDRVERDDFIVEKLQFQSRPGLYVTANFYMPKQVDNPLPTILYL